MLCGEPLVPPITGTLDEEVPEDVEVPEDPPVDAGLVVLVVPTAFALEVLAPATDTTGLLVGLPIIVGDELGLEPPPEPPLPTEQVLAPTVHDISSGQHPPKESLQQKLPVSQHSVSSMQHDAPASQQAAPPQVSASTGQHSSIPKQVVSFGQFPVSLQQKLPSGAHSSGKFGQTCQPVAQPSPVALSANLGLGNTKS